jgi:nitroreductase
VDASLAVAVPRHERQYAGRPVPGDAVSRILDARGTTGSAKNCQSWRFLVLGTAGWPTRLRRPSTHRPTSSAPRLVIVIVVGGMGLVVFDAGRAAQDMMLAAWSEGVVSGPNGIASPDSLAELFGLEADEQV